MFQVVNRGVPKAPRDTVLVPPKQTVEVEFDTNNRASGSATATTLTTSGRG
jgi:FtsP/CotA-like multicopper oxidase with cupredoxin domain